MTEFRALLAFPMPEPNSNNQLVIETVEALDLAGCLVEEIQFQAYNFKLAGPSEMAMTVKVRCDHPFDFADDQEKETWLQAHFDVTPDMPECAIVEIR